MNLFDPNPRSALEFLPARHDLASLREAAANCRGCDLYREATQVVFGEGRAQASILMVGEQPGDREDREGKPFVGPAGQLLDKCLQSAGIDRRRGLHHQRRQTFQMGAAGQNPAAQEAQFAGDRGLPPMARAGDSGRSSPHHRLPRCNRCAGLTGIAVSPDQAPRRGVSDEYGPVTATIHPSAILRMPEPEAREAEMASLHRI